MTLLFVQSEEERKLKNYAKPSNFLNAVKGAILLVFTFCVNSRADQYHEVK